MKTSVIRKKRIKSGYSKNDVANHLNLNPKVYEEIESGRRLMPTKLFEEFNRLINQSKENPNMVKIQRAQKEIEAEEFREEIVANNCEKLKKLFKKFNIENNSELAKLLEVSPSTVCHYLKGKKVSNDFKEKIMNFFNNELNIQINGSERRNMLYQLNEETIKKIGDYFSKSKTSRVKFAKEYDIPISSLACVINGRNFGKKLWNKVISSLRDHAIKNGNETLFNEIPWNSNEGIDVPLIDIKVVIMEALDTETDIEPNINLEEIINQEEDIKEEDVTMKEEPVLLKSSEEIEKEIQAKIEELNSAKQREAEIEEENEFRKNVSQFVIRARIIKEEFIKEGFDEDFALKMTHEIFLKNLN